MARFELSPGMLTGIDDIDFQHRKLLGWGNALREDATGEAVQKVEETLLNLTRYVAYHFRAEEEVMKRFDYALLGKHQTQHERLMLEVSRLVSRLREDGATRGLLIELQGQFIDWFVHHIKEWDQPLAGFLKENKVPPQNLLREGDDDDIDWMEFGWQD